MQTLLARNPHIEGIWSWTQDGGPWRAGPMSLYLKSGFWQLYEQDNRVAGEIARDPGTDVGQADVDWVRTYLADDPATVRAVVQALAQSRRAIQRGLYLRPYAEQSVRALGLEPPPQMWLFEWDILTGDSAALDLIYSVVRSRLDETIADGDGRCAGAADAHDRGGHRPGDWRTPQARADMLAALDYEADTLRLLAAYRTMVLRDAQWHDTDSSTAYDAWRSARDVYQERAGGHLRRYRGDVQHPSWNLTAAHLGVQRADRDRAMAWAARGLLVLVLAWLLLALRLPAARATVTAATRPWHAGTALSVLGRSERLTAVGVPAVLVLLTRGVQTSSWRPRTCW